MKFPSLQITRSTIAISIKVTTLLAATVAIYFQDLTIISHDAVQSEFMSYILAVPFLLSYLIYRKRKMIRASIPFEPSPSHTKGFPNEKVVGALLFLIALLTYWYGSYTFTPLEFHMLSLPIFVTACTLIIFNTQTLRQLAFPILFLFFLTPPPLQIVSQAGTVLSTISSQASYNILRTLGLPVDSATQYGTTTILLQRNVGQPITFVVDIACSGMYSLIGFLIFAVFITYTARTSPRKKAMIFLTGFPLVYLLNIFRITITVLIGNYAGKELATQTFHLLGSWALIFTGGLLLFTISERLFKIQLFTTKSKPTPCNYCKQKLQKEQHFCPSCGKLLNPLNIKLSKGDLGKIAILTITAILIINLQAPVFALTQGPAEVNIQTIGGEQTTTEVLPEMPGYMTDFVYRDRRFEEIAKQEASLIYAYKPTNTSKPTVWVSVEIAKTRACLYSWEGCLIKYPLAKGHQPHVTQLNLKDVQLLQNPPITARYFVFQDIQTNLTQAILYWYENALFNTGSDLEQKHMKISIITFSKNLVDIPQTEDQLLSFGEAIANYWQPIKTWSQITLTISQHAPTLIFVTTTLLAIVLVFQAIKESREKKSNLKIYNRLALQEDKLILQAAHQADKEDKPTGIAVSTLYRRAAGKPIDFDALIEKLHGAQRAGLIKREIASREDDPILIWKSQMSFPRSSIMHASFDRLIE